MICFGVKKDGKEKDSFDSFDLNMPPLKKVREGLLLAYDSDLINVDEFVLLYNVNKSKNPDLPYLNYDKFDLDNMSEDGGRVTNS